jgi:S-adenosylmethionine:tRNA ribosyltransferase-isomerase
MGIHTVRAAGQPHTDQPTQISPPLDSGLNWEASLESADQLFDFTLPARLEAGEPPEARGLSRDQVRLMVSWTESRQISHTHFSDLEQYLQAGDLLVINTSGTLNAALTGKRSNGQSVEVHLSTHLPADLWVIELRQLTKAGSAPLFTAVAGEQVDLPAGGVLNILLPYRGDQRQPLVGANPQVRLWLAELQIPLPWQEYLETYGFPIRYKYVRQEWPPSYYQTVYATEPGSAEMPSAGRAFTPPVITRLVARGVGIAPLLLHTGVASLEKHEPPYPEYYQVPVGTARAVNAARASGNRVIAVGTTVVRALESSAGPDGLAYPREGWTSLVITPDRSLRLVDGLLTGLHEPHSSHLMMLAALVGYEHLRRTYQAALKCNYLWHEFGDLHLILPGKPPAALDSVHQRCAN